MQPAERVPITREIRFRTHLRNTVLDVMRSRGWKETDSETDWDFFWADVGWIREQLKHVRLEEQQRVNHYPNHYELTRKDLTIKNLKRMKKALEREDKMEEAERFEFFPQTYCLPADYGLFEVDFKRNPNMIWIMKPPAKAQGKGIFLFTKVSQIAEWRRDYRLKGIAPANEREAAARERDAPEAYLAQRYIDNPHLVGGKKYDLRIYCLVSSWTPLTVWLYRSGFARLCHHRYSRNDTESTFIHVTNVAVQKTNPRYNSSSGCKWGLRQLKGYLVQTVGEVAANKCFGDIQAMIMRTLQAVQKIMMQDKHCFEVYGYDVLIDDTLRPWLMEINASPSLTAETPGDYHLKFNMLEDMLNVVDLEHRRVGNEERIGGYDLIWKGGPVGVMLNDPSTNSIYTYLGCNNELAIPITKIKMPPKFALKKGEQILI